MNPKHLRVRMDRTTGDLWLTEERHASPIRRVKNITDQVLLALCADLVAQDGTESVSRDVKFAEADGRHWTARIVIERVEGEGNAP